MDGENCYSYIGSKYFIGLSGIFGITVIAGLNATIFKHGGGGTLWAGGPTVGVNSGYLMTLSETINANNSGTLYFTAAGTTATLYVFNGRSSGYEP